MTIVKDFKTFGEFSDFEFSYKFNNAMVYSHKEIGTWQFIDDSEDVEDLAVDTISKGTRVGYLDYDNDTLKGIIVFTEDSNYYGDEDGEMISDSALYFELEPGIYFVPASEPVDAISSGYENGGGTRLDNVDELKAIVEKYKLNHLLQTS